MQISPKVDHDRLAAWVESMKPAFQEALDEFASSGHQVNGANLGEIRNHLECMAMIQVLLQEHLEMANSIKRDFGRFKMVLSTQATLYRANGEVVEIKRPKSMSLAWDHGPKGEGNG